MWAKGLFLIRKRGIHFRGPNSQSLSSYALYLGCQDFPLPSAARRRCPDYCFTCRSIATRAEYCFVGCHRVETVVVCRGKLADVRGFTAAVPKEVVVCADEQGQLIDAYRILRTPYALSLDRDGILRYKGVPGADLESLSHFVVPLIREEIAASTLRRPRVSGGLSNSHTEFATANVTGDV
jgi:hypothetical protein